MLPKVGIQEVVILAGPVEARRHRGWICGVVRIRQLRYGALMRDGDLRAFLVQPCRNGIRRRTQNYLDARLVQAIKNALHPGKLKFSVTRTTVMPAFCIISTSLSSRS